MRLGVLKLGGSILTAQSPAGPRVRRTRVRELADEIAGAGRAVLVHGSGAFGKPPAVRHDYVGGRLGGDAAALVSAVTTDLEVLHGEVLAAVRAAGIPAMSLQAAHLFAWIDGAARLHGAELVRQMLARGVMPVVASGFVPDHDAGGFAVASSDAIAAQLAIALHAQRLVFATAARGVYKRFPDLDQWHERLTENDAQALSRVAPSPGDVTGGMREKLRHGFAAARHRIDTLVIDGRRPRDVGAALRDGACAGTRLVAARTRVLSTHSA